MADTKFANGMRVEKPRDNAPDFVIAKASFEVESFKKYLDENINQRGWVNVDILRSKEKGTYYAVTNDYKADMTKPTSLSKDAVEGIQKAREAHNEGVDLNYNDEISASEIPF